NLAKKNPDSAFYAKYIADSVRFKRLSKIISEKQVYRLGQSFLYSGVHNFFKNSGEAPVIINEQRTKRSITRLQRYYFDQGYFNNKIQASVDSVGLKKGQITYNVTTGPAFMLDSISTVISSPDVLKLYNESKNLSVLKSGQRLELNHIEEER
ncbi:POTRA domain-containing protein, partial [Arthrospira platensis SPKY1]|nr:POTRA domain-containing protein [Arthrospira platensis SPKY1]